MVYNYTWMFASANKNAVLVYSRSRIAEKYLLFAIANSKTGTIIRNCEQEKK